MKHVIEELEALVEEIASLRDQVAREVGAENAAGVMSNLTRAEDELSEAADVLEERQVIEREMMDVIRNDRYAIRDEV